MDLFTRMILEAENPNSVTAPDTPPDFTSQQKKPEDPNASAEEQPTSNAAPANNITEEPPEDNNAEEGSDEEMPAEGEEGEETAPEEDESEEDGEQLEAPQEPNPEDELQQSEKEVFSELKPEQMNLKVKELKEQYKKINSIITASIDKINKSSRNSYDDNMIEFIHRKLTELRDLSRDSLLYSFATRSYIENQVELQRIIVAFNLVCNMVSEIRESRIKRRDIIDKKNDINTKKNTGLFRPIQDRNIHYRNMKYSF